MATQILLNPIGSGGDVFPFLAIGRELQHRGHHVAVMTNSIFIDNVGQAGLEFIEIGSKQALRDAGSDPDLHQPGNAWKLALKWGAVGTMRQTFDVIKNRIQKCDTMLIAPCIGLGSRIASEKFRVPMATAVLSPFVVRSEFQSPLIKPMVLADWVPRISKRLQFWLADRFFIDPLMEREVTALRNEIGLEPCSRLLHRWCFSKDLTLGLFPELFAPPQPDWPQNMHLTGTVSWDPPLDNQMAHEFDQWIDPNKKAIVVLAGSAGPESNEFYSTWIQASKRLGRQLILLEKNTNLIPKEIPDHVIAVGYFPIDELLKNAAVIAHAGGVGTTLRSLAAGTPQIVFPKVNDQPDNARRVARLGTGKIISAERMTIERIVSALSDVIDNDVILKNCDSVKNAIPTDDPIQKSCNLIEKTFAESRK